MILSQVLELVPEESLNQIKTSILKILDEKIKNRYYINKHFQNAIMNYFLEDYGSFYLRDQFDKQSNREVRRYLTSLAVERGYKGTKYMIMMNIYFDVHKSFNLITEYRQLLKNVALQENSFDPDSQEYISHAWKKAFGLFVLAHSFDRSLTSIFDIWNSLFLDQKIFRKRRPNSKTSYANNAQKAQTTQKSKNNVKAADSESDDESVLSQTDKEENKKNGVKQEFGDASHLSCATAPTMMNGRSNNTLKVINLNISADKQKQIYENSAMYAANYESTSDSISHTSNNISESKEQRIITPNIHSPNLSIFAMQQQLPFPHGISPHAAQFMIQGQKLMSYPQIQMIGQQGNGMYPGVVPPFGQQAFFVNPQQMLVNPQQMISLQQQQQLFQQQYQQQMMLFEQQKQYSLMMANQIPVPQTVGMM